ncbi:MAG: nucleoside 2-deoxyribosyltransferase [Candidatus Aenigmatarchaeota archaeon]
MNRVYLSIPIIANRNLEIAKIIAETIENEGYEIISKWVLEENLKIYVSPRDILKRDIEGVLKSDMLIAEVSNPSHGVGMEVAIAFLSGKKIILVKNEDSKLSYMLQGIPDKEIIEYTSKEDMKEKLSEKLKFLKNEL